MHEEEPFLQREGVGYGDVLDNKIGDGMDSDSLKEVLSSLKQIESRLDYLERRLGVGQVQIDKAKSQTPPPLPKAAPAESPKAPEKPSNLLGIVGVCCLIVAMILLIKFSIDSGWLTPARQLVLAGLFGSALVSVPFFFQSKEKDYLSLLPAAGIVILHLTVYGGVYYHMILDPMIGTGLIWGIGFLSLWLLKKLNEDIYAILSIAGIYVGSILVRNSFQSFTGVAGHIFIWDIIFVHFAINLKKRFLIAISAYFALFLIAAFGVTVDTLSTDMAIQLATIQFLQIVIFMIGTALYSVWNNALKESEVIQLLPVFLFFYGLEFYYLDTINTQLATGFSIVFSGLILGTYASVKKKMTENSFESSRLIYAFVTVLLLHSIYFVTFNELARVIAGLVILVFCGLKFETLNRNEFKGVLYLLCLTSFCSMLIVLAGNGEISKEILTVAGILYGAILFAGYKKSSQAALIAIANILVVVSITRIGDMFGEIVIGPLSVGYAFACLMYALKSSDKILAQASLPVIFFAIGRFVFFNFSSLSQIERIGSLIVMGGLIYVGGFVYRKIPAKK